MGQMEEPGARSRPGDQAEAEARTTWPQHNENEGNFQFANSASRMLRKRERNGKRGEERGREGKGMAATGGNGDRRTGATTHETAQNARWPLQVLKCFRLRGCLPTTAT